ncbi:hypothetical protein X975_14651, partial [Stegodyphus mimosarum]
MEDFSQTTFWPGELNRLYHCHQIHHGLMNSLILFLHFSWAFHAHVFQRHQNHHCLPSLAFWQNPLVAHVLFLLSVHQHHGPCFHCVVPLISLDGHVIVLMSHHLLLSQTCLLRFYD